MSRWTPLGNWRWWALLPVVILCIPSVALDLALTALVSAGEEAYDFRRWHRRKWHRAFMRLTDWRNKKEITP